MTICPVALAVGCAKCPIFKVCPVKGLIGDYVQPSAPSSSSPSASRPPAAKKTGKKKGS